MRNIIGVSIIAVAMVCTPAITQAERGSVRGTDSSRGNARGTVRGNAGFEYKDISRRNTQSTERDARQKKAAEEAKKKAEKEKQDKEREERMKRWREEREKRDDSKSKDSAKDGKPTDPRAAARAAAGKPAAAPKTTGGSYDPTTRQVTEVMLDAVKTQEVKFDAAAAAEDPSIILLNEPRHDPAKRKRAAEVTGIGQPL